MRKLKSKFTAEDLHHLPSTDQMMELVRGKVYEIAPAEGRHGSVARRIASRLGNYADERRLGEVFAAETGFILRRNSDTVRAPDAAFVSEGRLPEGDIPAGYPELAPDLVVEVLSPNDRGAEVASKVDDWLTAGVRLVWVLDPTSRTASVHRSGESVGELSQDDSLVGESVIPGFVCPTRGIFA